jgi:uncharacterized protein with ParB-like and HNH nuclease domain
MSEALFKEVCCTLSGLVNDISTRQNDLPDIERPFVWNNTKIRDLFDSLYQHYKRLVREEA